MTDKIREAFEKWNNWHNFWNASPQDAFKAGYLAGRQSLLDELERVEVKQLPYETDGRTTKYKQYTLYRLPEGVTK